MKTLLGVGDDPFHVQVDEPVGEHLGMHPEVPLVLEVVEHRVGDGADARLDGGPVGHETGHVEADAIGHFGALL